MRITRAPHICRARFDPVFPTAAQWWQSLRWVLLVITFLLVITLAGSFVPYEQVVQEGHPWLPNSVCPGCLLCGMTRSFCAMSSGYWKQASMWNRGGPPLYMFFWVWLVLSSLYLAFRLRKAALPRRAALIILLVVAGTSCGTRAPEWKQALKHQLPEAQDSNLPPLPNTTEELVIYLDTSASMAGYVTRDGQSIFGKTLRELRYATGTFGNSNARVLVRRIASDVGPILTDMELTTASKDQNVYRGGETNLANAISSFALPTRSEVTTASESATIKTATNSTEADPIPRFHILVTDGVQSTKQGSASHDCTSGSDQFCVRQKIGELLNKNWAGCVLGIRADFRGKVYSEVNKVSIPYETRLDNPATFRPFYLYIFSPDPRALDSLVSSLKDRLRPLVPTSEPIRELNLSFPYVNGTPDFDVVIDKNARSFITRKKDRGGPPPRLTIEVDVDTENTGPKPFSLVAKLPWTVHALDTASEVELAQLLNWSVEPIYPVENENAGKRFPEIKILRTRIDSPGQLTVDVTAQFPRGRAEPSWRVYVLKAQLNLDQTTTPSWIKQWSVDLDTTREVGNRTFNLETALLGLWNTSKLKDQVVAKAHIRIGPK